MEKQLKGYILTVQVTYKIVAETYDEAEQKAIEKYGEDSIIVDSYEEEILDD